MAVKRRKIKLRYKAERVLFSDVLPYELPVIFSNRYYYRFLIENEVKLVDGKLAYKANAEQAVKDILMLMFDAANEQTLSTKDWAKDGLKTIPFSYQILHKPTKARSLSVVHPVNQIEMVAFYEKYKSLMLYYCNRDEFSIRHPKKVACYFYYRDKLHHQLLGRKADPLELFFHEYENLKSYFSYHRYTKIHKFYEDYLYQRAEKKFPHLLKFDVQSCFDSIYTHSIAWATSGGKDAYKQYFKPNDRTFGIEFDAVMERMNYNETNGIVIGPEFSRIFAEIIMQHIDCSVKKKLQEAGYKVNVDYLCYRYVDDYFFFYNEETVKDKALKLFDEEMKEYKLSISDSKTVKYDRPFITPLTIAKQSIDRLVTEYLSYHDGKEVKDEHEEEKEEESRADKEEMKLEDALQNSNILFFRSNRFIAKYKAVIKTTGVENKDVVNYALSRIEIKLLSVLKQYDIVFKRLSKAVHEQNKVQVCKEKKLKLEQMLSDYLVQITDISFFLYADCKRINTTLKLMNILNKIIIYLDNDYFPDKTTKIERFTNVIRDTVFRNIQKEVDTVFRLSKYQEETPLETLFLLITIRSLRDKYRINQDVIDKYLGIEYDETKIGSLKSWPKMNALVIILLLYYYGNSEKYLKQRYGLNKIIMEKFREEPKPLRRKRAELIILLLDLMACPFLRSKDREKICGFMGVGGKKQKRIEAYLKKKKYMFTRWTSVNLTKELGAKVSLEVYS